MTAIDLLNKMDKLYTEGTTVNVDARSLTIIGDLTDEQLALIATGGDNASGRSRRATEEASSS